MGLGVFGSSQSPSWAGWDWPGAGYGFASKWTSPSFDVKITEVAAYFDTYQGNGALGTVAIWNNDGSVRYSHQFGIINNGSQSAGGQAWWVVTVVGSDNPPHLLPASTTVWIGGYSNQGTLFSTYDTSPHAWIKSMGTGGVAGFISPSDTGQGPCGAWIQYSPLVYPGGSSFGNPVDVGAAGGGIKQLTTTVIVAAGATLAELQGGIAPVNADVLAAFSARLGAIKGGLTATASVRVPKLRIWRP